MPKTDISKTVAATELIWCSKELETMSLYSTSVETYGLVCLTNALKMWNPDIIPSKANTVVLCYIGSHPSPKKKKKTKIPT